MLKKGDRAKVIEESYLHYFKTATEVTVNRVENCLGKKVFYCVDNNGFEQCLFDYELEALPKEVPVICKNCEGEGMLSGSIGNEHWPEECEECKGIGQIQVESYKYFEDAIADFLSKISELDEQEQKDLLMEMIKNL